jgi:hypothetical protein
LTLDGKESLFFSSGAKHALIDSEKQGPSQAAEKQNSSITTE